MTDPFVHLRVASGYSLQYGASHPSTLVERAAEYEMDTLALTDRDGLYGAIRFAKACLRTGIAPVVGVDFAVGFEQPELTPARPRGQRTPTRGGEVRDPRLPRVVTMAMSRTGWSSLCRLTSATHLAGERGAPVTSRQLIGEHSNDVLVMLGADSEVGLALAQGRPDVAEQVLRRWQDVVDDHHLVIAATDHDLPGDGAGSLTQAGRMLAFADTHGLTGVLTNAVRMADRQLAPTVDVLDSARRLVPLDLRNVDRRNAEGYLKPGKQMLEVAAQVAQRAGRGARGAEQLLGDTRRVAMACRLDPRADIGLGEIHLPEFSVVGGGSSHAEAMAVLRRRCEDGTARHYPSPPRELQRRLADELSIIEQMGFAAYFLTVADVVAMVKGMGIRCAARGSGAGSVVNYVLGISGVEPLRYGLIMERFLSPLRQALPDIDLDVESARRTEVYERILATFGGERVACVAMLDTYRVRHAVRDVGAALSLPPGEIDAIATAFPHIRAKDARAALRDLPELRAAGLGERRLDVLFSLVESLDGLPRHIALHPCGVLLSDSTLLSRTPLEASFGGFPMSQFDKDDVEDIGLLKLDVLGIRMQSSMSHALDEIARTEGVSVDIDSLAPFDDPDTYRLIQSAATLGCFQIESPGQRELVGKFGPETFNDIVIDISLFRPGPVKSDMVTPFLNARQGWNAPVYLHPDLEPVLAETGGVVVFHEQVIKIIAVLTGCTLAQGDEARRGLGDIAGQLDVKQWFVPACRRRGYSDAVIAKAWDVLVAFASFGFCKAHAAAFALPTYQSAWLKTHYPAHFIAGLLTHDPGMYPKRLILEEARRMGIAILSLDVNASDTVFRVEKVGRYDEPPPAVLGEPPRVPVDGLPDGRDYGIRLSLADVSGMSEHEMARIVAGRPYQSLTDFWARAGVSAPVVERLVLAGAFDSLYSIGRATPVRRRGQPTRRDLLLAVADLQRTERADARAASRGRGLRRASPQRSSPAGDDPREKARAQAVHLPTAAERAHPVEMQLALDFTDPEERSANDIEVSGLPEMSDKERLEAELAILGVDASRHVMDFYRPFVHALGVTFATDLLNQRNRSVVLIAGVKVATQTPPVRSGRRVVFLTLDDATGPVDATFFEDVQGPYAATMFSSWLLVVRGEVRRTGPRGISLTATGAWDLAALHQAYTAEMERSGDEQRAMAAVHEVLATVPEGFGMVGEELPREEAAPHQGSSGVPDAQDHGRAGGMGRRRVLVHASGFKQSPYADVLPAGTSADSAPRKLWHSSPGSSGR